jgi:hypothetical protein
MSHLWTPTRVRALSVVAALLLAAGCEQIKSSSPLSPAIAGPIAGVTISPPAPMQPNAGQKVVDTDQPVTLAFNNAESNSVRPYTMQVQIALDSAFTNIVFSQTGIGPSEDGTTQFVLPVRLDPGRVYFWRMKAEDGANASEWSEARQFEVLQPIVIGVPEPLSPVGGVRVTTTSPTLRVRNGQSSGPHGPLGYVFQVARDPGFSDLIMEAWIWEDNDETTYRVPSVPIPDILIYWRVRITDGTNGGDWSGAEVFRTPLAPTPGTGGGGTGGGGGGGTGPSACASSSGPAVVACIEAQYPERLVAGVSLSEREDNMAFLRDRVIEAGICGGMDLAWNLKRGVGPHSIDAIAWRTGGTDEVVDIGLAFDDTSTPLHLQWGIVGGPPGYDPYPPFSCD